MAIYPKYQCAHGSGAYPCAAGCNEFPKHRVFGVDMATPDADRTAYTVVTRSKKSDPAPKPAPLTRSMVDQFAKDNGLVVLTAKEHAKLEREARGNRPPPIPARALRF